jgi:hypothetical protein
VCERGVGFIVLRKEKDSNFWLLLVLHHKGRSGWFLRAPKRWRDELREAFCRI